MIKLKSLIVIIVSSILISLVILTTIFGLSLYTGYKEGESAKRHRVKIAQLNAKLYSPLIIIEGLRAKYENKGIYKDKCLLEGTIKNDGYRTVSSVKIKVRFLSASGEAIYTEEFLPLKTPMVPRKTTIAAISLFTSGRERPLMPGKSLKFKRLLDEQKNKDIISPIKNRRYATNPNEWSGKFDYEITEIRF